MRYLTILLLFLSTTVFSQKVENIHYNKVDTTWTFQYHPLLLVRAEIEILEARKEQLKKEITKLEEIGSAKDVVIKKLQLRDSLSYIELQHYETMDSLLREKLDRYNTITNNYNALLLSTQDQLNAEAKKARRERIWKNVYKYGYPVAIAVVGFLIIKY